MTIFLIISGCLLWTAALALLPRRVILGPPLSYCAMLLMSLTVSKEGYPLFPLPSSLLISWLCITLAVMLVVVLQSPALRAQSRGVVYMTAGGVAGMLTGLASLSLTSQLSPAYALMILGAAIGTSLGLLFFSYTPKGREIAPRSGYFFKYLLAKGFPVLITVAQLGIILVIIAARHLQ